MDGSLSVSRGGRGDGGLGAAEDSDGHLLVAEVDEALLEFAVTVRGLAVEHLEIGLLREHHDEGRA